MVRLPLLGGESQRHAVGPPESVLRRVLAPAGPAMQLDNVSASPAETPDTPARRAAAVPCRSGRCVDWQAPSWPRRVARPARTTRGSTDTRGHRTPPGARHRAAGTRTALPP